MTSDVPLVDRWRALLCQCSRITHELDRELQSGHGLAMSDYEVLDRLLSCGDKARVHDLMDGMHLSQSALSRTVARLEKGGLVQRAMCATDRRGVMVTPTAAGRELHAAARETYLTVLSRHLG